MDSAKKIAIIHFQPLEAYPPVMNALRFLPSQIVDLKWSVITTNRDFGLAVFDPKNSAVKIHRLITQSTRASRILRLISYIYFYIRAFLVLLMFRPDKVIYYESISSLPAIWYKKLFKNTGLLIHYHEYTSPVEYDSGMIFNRISHRAEKSIFSKAIWISHTNADRMRFFLEDENLNLEKQVANILPNYPPESWLKVREDKAGIDKKTTKLVYVGSMGFDTTYIREVCDWVIKSDGRFSLDVYSYQMEDAVRNYFDSLNSTSIQLHPPINYVDIPNVIKSFDVGLILYKGHIPNYVYNAPNKLYEYHICGLEVWFPKEMEGCKRVDQTIFGPSINCVDFNKLEQFVWKPTVRKEHQRSLNEYPYTYQKALRFLVERLA